MFDDENRFVKVGERKDQIRPFSDQRLMGVES